MADGPEHQRRRYRPGGGRAPRRCPLHGAVAARPQLPARIRARGGHFHSLRGRIALVARLRAAVRAVPGRWQRHLRPPGLSRLVQPPGTELRRRYRASHRRDCLHRTRDAPACRREASRGLVRLDHRGRPAICRCQYPPRPRPSGNTALRGPAPPEPKCGDSGSRARRTARGVRRRAAATCPLTRRATRSGNRSRLRTHLQRTPGRPGAHLHRCSPRPRGLRGRPIDPARLWRLGLPLGARAALDPVLRSRARHLGRCRSPTRGCAAPQLERSAAIGDHRRGRGRFDVRRERVIHVPRQSHHCKDEHRHCRPLEAARGSGPLRDLQSRPEPACWAPRDNPRARPFQPRHPASSPERPGLLLGCRR